VVHTLAANGQRLSEPPRDPDDFVHVLLGLASLGEAVERLTNSATVQPNPTVEAQQPAAPTTRWLR
jgi:hypothetical protein